MRATYTTDCICPGQNATFECTVVGGNFTVWNGSIMEPPECKIQLQHFEFLSRNERCNSGAVIGQAIETNGSCYTSRLSVLVTPNIDGGDVSCNVDIAQDEIPINTMIINITPGPGKHYCDKGITVNS